MVPKFTGYRLRKSRKLFGLSQREAAQLLGVTPTQLMEWECGKRMPVGRNLFKLGVIYKRLIEDIYREERQVAIREVEANKRKYGFLGPDKPP